LCMQIFTGQRISDLPKTLNPNNISETYIDIVQQKEGERVFIPLYPKLKKHAHKIIKKYPNGFPEISEQKFNNYIKELCEDAGFTRKHTITIQSGKNKNSHTEFRYNLISTHTARRTFATLADKEKIPHKIIMKVTGHKSYDEF